MASPLVSLFSAGINSAFTPFTVLIMVTFMKFAFDAEDVATDAVNDFELFDVGAASAGGDDVGEGVACSTIVVVTTLSASKFSFVGSKFNFVISKFNFVVSKFNFVGGVTAAFAVAVVFGVGEDANDESTTTTLSCLSLLSSLWLVIVDAMLSSLSLLSSLGLVIVDPTLSCFSLLLPSIVVILKWPRKV